MTTLGSAVMGFDCGISFYFAGPTTTLRGQMDDNGAVAQKKLQKKREIVTFEAYLPRKNGVSLL